MNGRDEFTRRQRKEQTANGQTNDQAARKWTWSNRAQLKKKTDNEAEPLNALYLGKREGQ